MSRTVSRLHVAAIGVALSCAMPSYATVWYVNPGGQPPADGTSFSHGFPTIQQAADAAQPKDEVWVVKGTYAENVSCLKGVAFYGGFAGTETDRSQADPATNVTTIDGGNHGPAITIQSLNPQTSGPEALDGFTIQNGGGATFSGKWMGGGALLVGSADIARCVFRASSADYGGGLGYYGTGTIHDNLFTGNTALNGGALAIINGSATVYRNTFDQNTKESGSSGARGGAVYVETQYPALSHDDIYANTFSSNSADIGGAIALVNASQENIHNNTFTGNAAGGGSGGGIYVENSTPVLIAGNVFQGNGASYRGNAVYASVSGSGSVVVSGNLANANGSILFSGDGAIASLGATVVNNTVVNNGNGGISLFAPSHTANNIVAENFLYGIAKATGIVPGPLLNNDVFGNQGDAYSNLPDPTGTSGNIKQDPLFLDAPNGDFHLRTGSPCIDAGSTPDAVAYDPATDFDGEARVYGSAVDIGMDEWAPILSFATQPGNGRPNQALDPQPVVALKDRAGSVLTGYSGAIQLAIRPGTGQTGAALHGTASVIAANGAATFTDLSIDRAGLGYVLTASGAGLSSVDSLPLNVYLLRSYVRTDGDDAKDGSSWANARQSIPAAFPLTAGPDAEVWVATGTYTGPVVVPDGITLYGGFAGTETARGQRNAHNRTTVIDAGGASAAVRFVGTSGNGVDGFRITGGIGALVADSLTSTHREGGGVYVNGASPAIRNNLITGNTANFGGGIGVNGGSPTVTGNTIAQNSALAASGTPGAGGGAALTGGSGLVFSDNFVIGNVASGQDAAHVASVGGGLAVSSSVDIHNNTLVANESPAGQGDVFISRGSPAFTNNIINNRAAIEKAGGTPVFSHNDYIAGAAVANPLPNPVGSNGNISVTPGFVNAGAGNYHLAAGSPLVDIGDDAAVLRAETDVDGQPRLMGAGVDIGADETAVPYLLTDAASALKMAGGLLAASNLDALRFDYDGPPGVDVSDAIRLARKAAGLDANP